jgi:TPR repeat protein
MMRKLLRGSARRRWGDASSLGVASVDTRAVMRYQKAAAQTDPEAMAGLAVLNDHRRVIGKDGNQAIALHDQPSDLGSAEAGYELEVDNEGVQIAIKGMEVDNGHIHLLICSPAKLAILRVVRLFKQISTYRLWRAPANHVILRKPF